MIVPRPLLLYLAAILGVPLIGLAVQLGGMFSFGLGVLLLVFVVLVVIDAMQGLDRLALVKVLLPEGERCIHGRKSQLGLNVVNENEDEVQLRLALSLPREIEGEAEHVETEIEASEAGKGTRVEYAITPRRRGLFVIQGCRYEITSPLGIWDVQGETIQKSAIRAYPNLASERKQMAALFLKQSQLGMKLTRQVGQGRDFEKLRDYVPGDSFDRIHWKATARRRRPITKVFQVERTQEVYVILDSSRLSGRLVNQDQPELGTHLDRYILAALFLGLAAEKQGDLFGLLTFADKVQSFVRARHGKEHYGSCREALYRLEPQPVSPDYQELMTTIRLRMRRRALLVFLTDVDDPVLGESFLQAVELISKQHLVLALMLQPKGTKPLFASPDITRVEEIYGSLAQHMAWQDLRQLSLQLKRSGVTLVQATNEQFSARLTTEYLRVKQRQLI